MRVVVLASCLVASSLASADPFDPAVLPHHFADLTAGASANASLDDVKPPRSAFTAGSAAVRASDVYAAEAGLSQYGETEPGAVIGKASDGNAAWLAVDIGYASPCGMAGCDKFVAPLVHALGVVDSTGYMARGAWASSTPRR